MDFYVSAHQTRSYVVSTTVYQGPLDLLLHLIERAELDITTLALAQVTDQFLAHLKDLNELSAEEVSAFLVIAARLIQIKSEVLLPRPPFREEREEDPGEALARQLRIYKQFKQVSEQLAQREAAGLHTYLRLSQPPRIEGTFDLGGLGFIDLVDAAREIFSKANQAALKTVVTLPRITIREKIRWIALTLRQRGLSTFRALLTASPSRIEIVVTFLALLELIKRSLIQVRQEGLFAEIDLEPARSWDESETFDLEFGE